jgi:pimeloyl-ACP methyl ester carboxylesterase
LQAGDGHTLVYEKIDGGAPGIVFLHGLGSDRHGNKANALATYCQAQGYGFLRFDMYGHGESSGKFEDGGPSRWREDAVRVLDELTQGPQILVGSSMGGWVMTLTALARPDRVAGLIGIAAAPDFTDGMVAKELSAAQQAQLDRDGIVDLPSDYGPPMRIGKHLIADGNRNLVLRGPIAITCPVRLLHGQRDEDVAWSRSMMLAEHITGEDVEVTLVKDGDHRLSRDSDLALLTQTLDRLVAQLRT